MCIWPVLLAFLPTELVCALPTFLWRGFVRSIPRTGATRRQHSTRRQGEIHPRHTPGLADFFNLVNLTKRAIILPVCPKHCSQAICPDQKVWLKTSMEDALLAASPKAQAEQSFSLIPTLHCPLKTESMKIFLSLAFCIYLLELVVCQMGIGPHHAARVISGDTSDTPCVRNAEVLARALRSVQTHLRTLDIQGPVKRKI